MKRPGFAACFVLFLLVFTAACGGSDEPELVDDVAAPTLPPAAAPTTPPLGNSAATADDGSTGDDSSADDADAALAPTVAPDVGAGPPAPDPGSPPAPVTVSGNATITVLTETGTYRPDVIECVINDIFISIIASGDGDLTVSGTSELLLIEFLDPAQNLTEISEPGVAISPGSLSFETSTGKTITAENCDSA